MTALALTDHGVLFGAIELYKAAKKAGIKPIVGCEMYVAKGKRTEKNGYNHLTVLAKDYTGYKNLVKLISTAHLEGYYYKPRIDFDLLKENHDGLIALSGCLSRPVSEPLVNGDFESARKAARMYKEVFGEDYYLEVHSHGLDDERRVLENMPKTSLSVLAAFLALQILH